MKFSIAVATAIFSLALVPFFANGHSQEGFGWVTLDVVLPKALSDHSASYSSDDGLIYLAGGCDSPKGNEFAGDFFFCASISDSLYSFDPISYVIEDLGSLPSERYRHSASVVNNQLWLVGGRDGSDTILPTVDVYDIASKEWTTYTLPEEYRTSDHAGFTGPEPFLYVAGGYNQTYGTLGTVFRINATAPTSSGDTLMVEVVAPLLVPRGDIHAARGPASATLGGGFTDANGFCAPLATVERYDIEKNLWEFLPELENERGEIVFVELDSKLYAMGGERQIENICEVTGDTDPGELTVGMDLVEVLEGDEWKIMDDFSSHKFRFAAVGVDKTGLVYAFGGQTEWNATCECFQTTNDIQVFGEGLHTHEDLEDSASTYMGMAFSLACGMVMAMIGIFN